MPGERILIVEDDGILAAHLQDTLTELGYVVAGMAPTGEDAVDAVGRTGFDVVLMDIELGGEIDGTTAAKQIRAISNVPIIFLTGYSNESLIEEAKTSAPAGYLVKPVPAAELRATIETALYRQALGVELVESRERYRTLVENIPGAVYRFGAAPPWPVIYLSEAAAGLTGISADQLTNRIPNWGEVILPEDYPRVVREIERETAMKRPFSTEYRISGADGRQSWVQQTGQCLYDREGKPKHLDGVMLDITERKVAEEQSRLLHETLDVIFNTTPVIMLLINRDLRIERINRAGATFAGFDTDELGGLLFGDALSCASLFQTEGTCGTTDKCPECPICAMIDRTFSTGRPLVEAECRLVLVRRRLPVEFHFLVSTAPVMVEKKPMVLLTATDITERKKLEESRLDMERRQHDTRRLESLVTVAGGVAHDFNNILTGVYGNMEMALSKLSEDSPARPFVAESLQSSRRAMSLANQMLMYTGQGFSRSQTVDLNQIVRKHLGPFANKHSGNFRVNMRLHDSAVNIFADPDQIRQVLLNLVNNSLEACAESPEGGCAVTVTTGIEECTPSYLSGSRIYEKPQEGAFGFLDISDTGCGMQAEILPRIFEPFFSTKFLGRGLGMPAVYGIVKSHHGALFVTSEPGKGTTVRILLPLKEAAGSGEGQIPEPEHSMQTPEP